ncbi:MAG: PASTA domain-containing protein [candidate division WOR-3 bacterium]
MVDRGTAFLISLITSLFVAIGVNFAFYYLIEPALEAKKGTVSEKTEESKNIEVPDLKGTLPQQAKLVLSQLGLSLVIEGEVETIEVPEGVIAEQRPLAGSIVSKGTSIYVKIAKGKKEEFVKVPPVSGLDLASAQKVLIDYGFLIGDIEKIRNSEIPEGRVVKTYPEQGSEIPKGSKITIYISSGEELVTVPNLIGKYLNQANQILEKEGLKLGEVEKEISAEYPENKIIDQNPKPGTKVKKGSSINIKIATVREGFY